MGTLKTYSTVLISSSRSSRSKNVILNQRRSNFLHFVIFTIMIYSSKRLQKSIVRRVNLFYICYAWLIKRILPNIIFHIFILYLSCKYFLLALLYYILYYIILLYIFYYYIIILFLYFFKYYFYYYILLYLIYILFPHYAQRLSIYRYYI